MFEARTAGREVGSEVLEEIATRLDLVSLIKLHESRAAIEAVVSRVRDLNSNLSRVKTMLALSSMKKIRAERALPKKPRAPVQIS